MTDSAARLPAALRDTGAVAAGVAVVGAATLAIAWAFEVVGGYLPCPLCLEQRIPYYVAVPIAAVAAWAALRGKWGAAPRLALLVVGLVFAWSMYLAGFHAGVEWGWWPGPTDCAVDSGSVTDAGGLLGQLSGARVVACDEPALRVLGLSFAGWNFVVSAGLALASFAGAVRGR